MAFYHRPKGAHAHGRMDAAQESASQTPLDSRTFVLYNIRNGQTWRGTCNDTTLGFLGHNLPVPALPCLPHWNSAIVEGRHGIRSSSLKNFRREFRRGEGYSFLFVPLHPPDAFQAGPTHEGVSNL